MTSSQMRCMDPSLERGIRRCTRQMPTRSSNRTAFARMLQSRQEESAINHSLRVLRGSVASLALLAVVTGAPSVGAQNVTPEETVRSVRKMLERLPYYGVFDFPAVVVERGTVTLVGYSFEGRLK